MKKILSVEEYILNSGSWQQALNMLREIMLALKMEETIKWNTPVYCINGKNVVGIASFKSYTGLWFYQGVFLHDSEQKLYNASEGRVGAMRQWRFSSADDIEDNLDTIINYIEEAIRNSKDGKIMKPQRRMEYIIPEELEDALLNDSYLKLDFENLTTAKKRDYCIYISQAKKVETRQRRLKKCIPLIKEGKGIMDIYKTT